MEIMEIVLLIIGGVVFIASFIIPELKNRLDPETVKTERETIQALINKEIEGIRFKIDDAADETISYAVEKTERSLERLSNEKIMAVNDYSDTVLAEINKNHQEVMFLYDMLNDKHENLKSTVSEVALAVKEAEQVVKEVGYSTKELDKKSDKTVRTTSISKDKPMESPVEKTDTKGKEKTNEIPNEKIVQDEQAGFKPFQIDKLDKIEKIQKTEKVEKVPAKPKRKTTVKAPVDISFAANIDNGKNSNEIILSLHQKGRSNMAIAKELGLGIGEVKLVIDLYEGM